MPKKIEFSVIHTTSMYTFKNLYTENIYMAINEGEDPKHRSTELNTHGPTVKGWQSEKNCEYPQEIVLQLEKRCSITKIQFLAHQYLIRN